MLSSDVSSVAVVHQALIATVEQLFGAQNIEIGQIGAYGRVLANRFNGFGEYDEVVLTDEPMLSMYEDPEQTARADVSWMTARA